MNINLIAKQIALLTEIQSLSAAASIFANSEVLIYHKVGGQVLPIADAKVQGKILNDSMLDELRSNALEAMDSTVAQLESFGVTLSEEALAEITRTTPDDVNKQKLSEI